MPLVSLGSTLEEEHDGRQFSGMKDGADPVLWLVQVVSTQVVLLHAVGTQVVTAGVGIS